MSRRDRLIRCHFRDRFVVTLKTGETFQGVLLEADESHYVFADSVALRAGDSDVPVDGHLWIARPDVAYLQVTVVPGSGFTG